MSMKTLYVKTRDQHLWDAAEDVAHRRRISLSALFAEILEDWSRRTQPATAQAMGLPAGFAAPSSLRDPEVLRREELASDIRDSVMKLLTDRDVS